MLLDLFYTEKVEKSRINVRCWVPAEECIHLHVHLVEAVPHICIQRCHTVTDFGDVTVYFVELAHLDIILLRWDIYTPVIIPAELFQFLNPIHIHLIDVLFGGHNPPMLHLYCCHICRVVVTQTLDGPLSCVEMTLSRINNYVALSCKLLEGRFRLIQTPQGIVHG